MAALSALQRAAMMWRNGVTFWGNRDLYRTFGWNRNPTYRDFVEMYRHQDVAGRVNDSLPKALWSDPPEISGDTPFNEAWLNLNATIPVFPTIQRLDKLAGLGRYAVLLIGFDDGRALDQPVATKAGRKVLFLQPYGEGSATVAQYESNTSSPRFGLPTMYTLSPQNVDPSFKPLGMFSRPGTFKVHYSRILHVACNALDSTLFGRSRLEGVFNILTDIQKVAGASAETYWLAGNRGLHIDIDKELELDETDEEALSDELKEYEHELRRTIRTRGVKINPLGSQVADPTGVFGVQISLLAARTGIPQRVLMGSEAGQLASQQDRAEWAQRVKEEINEYGGPIVLYPFIRTLIDAGVLTQPQSLSIKWPDAFKMNPLERAQTSAQMARSATNLANMLQKIELTNEAAAKARQNTVVPGMTDPLTGKTSPDTTVPAIIQGEFKEITLLTPEECRSIIGFGQHPPVFDTTDQLPAAVNKPGT